MVSIEQSRFRSSGSGFAGFCGYAFLRLPAEGDVLAKTPKSYWLVVPDLRSIYVYHHRNDSNIFGSNDILVDKVLGIELELKEVFGALERKG